MDAPYFIKIIVYISALYLTATSGQQCRYSVYSNCTLSDKKYDNTIKDVVTERDGTTVSDDLNEDFDLINNNLILSAIERVEFEEIRRKIIIDRKPEVKRNSSLRQWQYPDNLHQGQYGESGVQRVPSDEYYSYYPKPQVNIGNPFANIQLQPVTPYKCEIKCKLIPFTNMTTTTTTPTYHTRPTKHPTGYPGYPHPTHGTHPPYPPHPYPHPDSPRINYHYTYVDSGDHSGEHSGEHHGGHPGGHHGGHPGEHHQYYPKDVRCPLHYDPNKPIYFRSTDSCTEYFKCTENDIMTLKCDDGKVWSDSEETCVRGHHLFHCKVKKKADRVHRHECKTSSKEFHSIPGDCRGFIKCDNDGDLGVLYLCPKRLAWNSSLNRCDYSKNVRC